MAKLMQRSRRIGVPTETKAAAVVAKERDDDYLSYVQDHPDYNRIVSALQDGKSVKSIARWLEKDNRLNGHPVSVMMSAIYEFRRRFLDILQQDSHAADTIERLIKFQNNPLPDVDTELAKLYALQKRRIAVESNTEFQLGKLFDNTHKEIKIAIDMLEKMHQVQAGKDATLDSDIALSKRSSEFSPEVRSDLQNLKVTQATNDRMTTLLAQFTKHLHENKKNTKR